MGFIVVGILEGPDGDRVGIVVGILVGMRVGRAVGTMVGLRVGPLGAREGFAEVGIREGVFVEGDLVGT